MAKIPGYIYVILIFLIVITIWVALVRANDPVRVLYKQANYISDGEVSFIEIGTYTSFSTKDRTEFVNRIIDELDVKYAYYNFGTDEDNVLYAETVECSTNFKNREEMHNYVREDQPTESEIYIKVNDLDIDITRFQKCLNQERTYKVKIEQINDIISNIELKQIPTFIINGEVYEGSMSFEAISIAVDQSKDL